MGDLHQPSLTWTVETAAAMTSRSHLSRPQDLPFLVLYGRARWSVRVELHSVWDDCLVQEPAGGRSAGSWLMTSSGASRPTRADRDRPANNAPWLARAMIPRPARWRSTISQEGADLENAYILGDGNGALNRRAASAAAGRHSTGVPAGSGISGRALAPSASSAHSRSARLASSWRPGRSCSQPLSSAPDFAMLAG